VRGSSLSGKHETGIVTPSRLRSALPARSAQLPGPLGGGAWPM